MPSLYVRAYAIIVKGHLRTTDEPLDSTVSPRLVPWDGVQGRCQRSTGQVRKISIDGPLEYVKNAMKVSSQSSPGDYFKSTVTN
jgi:hypothetical protein